MNLETEEENVQEDFPSPRKANLFPSLSGFFPVFPLKNITKMSYESKYNVQNESGFPLNENSNSLHPFANSLDHFNKDNMESVRRSLIESHSVNDFNNNPDINAEKSFDEHIDNSGFGIMKDKSISFKNTNRSKKMTTFGRVSQMQVSSPRKDSGKDSEEEWELTNQKIKEMLEKMLNNNLVMALISLLTIYCLFGDDMRTAFVDKEYDIVFNVISIFCIFVFSIEIAISIVVKPNYYLSFFFWLDLVSAVSILLDLIWIQNLIFMGGQSSNIARASRFSRVGAKAGRVIRLVRLFRIVKLYKTFSQKQNQNDLKEMIEIRKNSIFAQDVHITMSSVSKEKSKSTYEKKETSKNLTTEKHKSIFQSSNTNEKWYLSPTLKEIYKKQSLESSQLHSISRNSRFIHDPLVESFGNFNELTEIEDEVQNSSESRVGKKLTDLTIKRVMIVTFVIIFIVPLFSSSYWFDNTEAYDIGLRFIKNYTDVCNQTVGFDSSNDASLISLCSQYIELNTVDDKVLYPLVNLQTPINNSACQYQSDSVANADLRDEEKDFLQIDEYTAIINKKSYSVDNSIISICRTFYICSVLAISALLFARDAHYLVLRPIERMLNKVNNISKNPLESKYQQLVENKNLKKNVEVMETAIIENAIIKISTLLALGLGDAGSEIITSNVAKMGDLVCITPGVKRYGIFGFCDIRNFTDATEVLQEDVMIFVNNIAEIVHTIVDRFQGSANKNIGDAFLVVWKFRVEDYQDIHEKLDIFFKNQELIYEKNLSKQIQKCKEPHNISGISDLCDLSLMSFLKILCKINSKEKILKYRENEELNKRLPHYKVKMGFGLHLGWAIEGSIGSDYKIDASYLSPNINLASRLEAATKQYGIPLLISHTLYEFLSNVMQKICRKIDVVTLKGSEWPIGLFTADLDLEKLPFKAETNKDIVEKREINILKKMAVALGLKNKTFKFEELFIYDKDIMIAYKLLSEEFRTSFGEGIQCYLEGNWKEATNLLKKALCFKENDGPCKTILVFMEAFGFEGPPAWSGYRHLIEK